MAVDRVGGDSVPRAGEGGAAQSVSRLTGLLNGTYATLDTGLLTTPPRDLPGPGTTLITAFQSGHNYSVVAGGTAGDNLNYTGDYCLGSQCVRLVTDGAATAKRLDKASLSFDTAGKHPVIWIKFDDITHLAGYEVWFGTNGGMTNYYRLSTMNSVPPNVGTEHLRSGEWMRVVIPWSAASLAQTNGTPTRSGITNVRIQILDDGTGTPVTAYINGLGLQDNMASTYPNGVVSMTFDDTYASQYTAAKAYMDRYGFPGTAYTIVEQVGNGGANLSLARLKTMQELSGWEVSGHAYSLTNHNAAGGFPALAPAVMEADVAAMRKWLLQNNFTSSAFAYPQGYHSASVEGVVRKYFGSGRTISTRTLESTPPSQPGRLRVRIVASTTSTATVQGWIDDAYTYGCWLILVFHSIDDLGTAGGNSYTTANFNAICDYLNTKGIPIRTVTEVLNTRPVKHAQSHAPGALDDTFSDGGQALTGAVETFHRMHATQGAATASQRLLMTHFTPRVTKTVSTFNFATGGTASSGLTLARLGLYTINSDGSYTLVAASLSDTTLGNAASTVYAKAFDTGGSLPASYTLKAGQRYAIGFLFVGTTMPTIYGIVPLLTTLTALSPSLGAFLNTQADLPASIAAGATTANNNLPWAYLS